MVHQFSSAFQVMQGLAPCIVARGVASGILQILDRLLVASSRLKVMGENSRRKRLCGGSAMFAGCQVKPFFSNDRDLIVQPLSIESMNERELRRLSTGLNITNELLFVRERHALVFHFRRRNTKSRCSVICRKFRANYGGCLKHTLLLCGETLELPGDHLPQAVRNGRLDFLHW